MPVPRDVTEITAWQLAHKLHLRVDLFLLSPDFRRYYKHAEKLRSAVSSGTRDIAEGFEHEEAAFAERVRRAKGSHVEVVHHLIDAHDQGLITGDELEIVRRLATRAIRAANGLLRSLEATTASDAAAPVKRRNPPRIRPGPTDSD